MAKASLPNTIAVAAKRMSQEARATLLNKYQAQAKSKGLNWVAWVFGVNHFYQRRYGMGFLFLLSLCAGGIGLIWWIFEAFRNNAQIDEFNNTLAMELLTEAKLLED